MLNNQPDTVWESTLQVQGKVEPTPLAQQLRGLLKVILTTSLLFGTDVFNIGLSMAAAILTRIYILPRLSTAFSPDVPAGFMEHLWWVAVVWIFCLAQDKLYVRRLHFWREAKRLVRSSLVAFILTMAIISLVKLGGEFSRTALVIAFCIGFFLLPLGRYICKNTLFRIGMWNDPVLVMGAGQTGFMIARSFQQDHYLGYKVIGFLDDDPTKKKKGLIIDGIRYYILGGFSDVVGVIHKTKIKHVILAAPGLPGADLVQLSNIIRSHVDSLVVVPDLFGISAAGGHVEYLSGDHIVAYHTHNKLANPVNIVLKCMFDKILGTAIFIVILPIIVILALLVKIDSPGSAFYGGTRIGQRGKGFKCYKFRSMYLNNDEMLEKYLSDNPTARYEWDKYAKIRGEDPRVTRIGKFLRKTSLDELPQIFNVLKGEMSLVGARPYLFEERVRLGSDADTILMTKPGMTGLWQVSGRNEIDFQGRVELETWYIHNWSLWTDISLLFRTVGVVLESKGAY